MRIWTGISVRGAFSRAEKGHSLSDTGECHEGSRILQSNKKGGSRVRYKCDKCGDTIYVDPGDERICDTCTQKIRIKAKEQENYYERWRKTWGNAIAS